MHLTGPPTRYLGKGGLADPAESRKALSISAGKVDFESGAYEPRACSLETLLATRTLVCKCHSVEKQ